MFKAVAIQGVEKCLTRYLITSWKDSLIEFYYNRFVSIFKL